MAGVDSGMGAPRESAQFAALLEMRWRQFQHNMRRGEKTSFVMWLLGRILILGFSVGAGAVACVVTYIAASNGRKLPLIFSTVFVGWQLMNLFRGSMPHGVEAELYRFPLRFRTYVTLWLSAGVFEGLTLLGSWICLGIFIGLVLAGSSVLFSGIGVLLFYALNLLLTRGVFLWLGRMLASRRTREFVLIVSSLLGVLPQVMRMQHERVAAWMAKLSLPPWLLHLLHWTPGAVTALAVAGARIDVVVLAAWCGVAAAILLVGLHRSFQGVDVHEFQAAASAVQRQRTRSRSTRDTSLVVTVASCEWARLRHGGAAIFATLSPLLYVMLFGLRLAHGEFGAWIVPAAVAYVGLSLRWVNVFGQDGPGVQLYLLSPVPLRTVLLGKNLFAALLYTGQAVLTTLLLCVFMHRVPFVSLLFTVLWMALFTSAAFAVGNYRSIVAPTFVSTAKVSLQSARRAGRSGGSWMGLLVIFGSAGLGVAIVSLCLWIHHAAWAPWMLLPFTVAAVLVYRGSLEKPEFRSDTIATTELLLLRVARSA